jgi:hypothetical protein
MRNRGRRGSALLEFTLAGIPLVFVLVSTFEIARGMWLYHTVAYAVQDAARFASLRGQNCSVFPNSCAVTVREIAGRLRSAGVGLAPAEVQNVRLISTTRTITCPTLEDCLRPGAAGDTYWPAQAPGAPADAGAAPGMEISLAAEYPFRSAIAMFWPGAGPGVRFGVFRLPARSSGRVQF